MPCAAPESMRRRATPATVLSFFFPASATSEVSGHQHRHEIGNLNSPRAAAARRVRRLHLCGGLLATRRAAERRVGARGSPIWCCFRGGSSPSGDAKQRLLRFSRKRRHHAPRISTLPDVGLEPRVRDRRDRCAAGQRRGSRVEQTSIHAQNTRARKTTIFQLAIKMELN